MLLRTELLGVPHSPGGASNTGSPNGFAGSTNVNQQGNGTATGSAGSRQVAPIPETFSFKSPGCTYSRNFWQTYFITGQQCKCPITNSPRKRSEKLQKSLLSAGRPALQDDFYLNLVDWSSQNVLAVGLAAVCTCGVLTSKVTKLTPWGRWWGDNVGELDALGITCISGN